MDNLSYDIVKSNDLLHLAWVYHKKTGFKSDVLFKLLNGEYEKRGLVDSEVGELVDYCIEAKNSLINKEKRDLTINYMLNFIFKRITDGEIVRSKYSVGVCKDEVYEIYKFIKGLPVSCFKGELDKLKSL